MGSNVITNIVRAEEGEPGDEATLYLICTILMFVKSFFFVLFVVVGLFVCVSKKLICSRMREIPQEKFGTLDIFHVLDRSLPLYARNCAIDG